MGWGCENGYDWIIDFYDFVYGKWLSDELWYCFLISYVILFFI